ncbi:transglycosylase SLT domain-containing protein [Alteromonas aestuariivivens]|nr:transglycosylase SLT domain-containing protein [Alteromonas aestuariivivens]
MSWISLVLMMIAMPVWATSASGGNLLPADDSNLEQRTQFQALEKAIRTTPKDQLPSLDSQFETLQGYPLYPYLVKQRLFRQLNLEHRAEVEQFLSRYDGHPLTYTLRSSWLRYLAKYGYKSAFMSSYREDMGAEITCHYLAFQIEEATNPAYWLSKVDDIWLTGKSQPEACDPLFRKWQAAGMMTSDKVLARLEKAVTSGDARLLPYLKRRLPQEQQYLADLWQTVRTNPAIVLRESRFPLTHPQEEAAVLAFGLERLAWSQPDNAVKGYFLWQNRENPLFAADALRPIHRAIALSMAIDNHPDAREWLERADVPGAEEDVKRWHMAYLLRQQNWQSVLAVIESVGEANQEEEGYLYWRARSYEALGMKGMALPIYDQLASERHFYGFMAGAKLAKTPDLVSHPAPRSEVNVEAIAQMPSAQRAYEFLQLGRSISARREWRYLLSQLDSGLVKDAAILASEWGWYDQAIVGFARSGYLDDVERRFPLAFAPQFSRVGETYNVHPAFAMAIARRESAFMADAVSPAGASGLMQLMPGTARYLAKKQVSRKVLFEPEQNVELGVQYLRYLMDKLDNNPVLVSASYNAGWKRVMEWLPDQNMLPTDIWIENIPYRETRHYVKAVLAYRYIYEHQLGTRSNLFEQLANTLMPTSTVVTDAATLGGLQLAPQ